MSANIFEIRRTSANLGDCVGDSAPALACEACNGFPNDYWGWGMEDDQLRIRAHACGAMRHGVLHPPSGVGRYADIDEVQMLREYFKAKTRSEQIKKSDFIALMTTQFERKVDQRAA